ncbi:MAG: hypothetical protein C4547_11090 [Phycisphaerales bacterium]|nr:MAG: hypothetical protein C4547_11090 [Phycisphaerales bacterium]
MGRESDPDIQSLVESYIAPHLPGATVEVSFSQRWQRPMVVVRWEGFETLLAEQRFRRLLACIPADVFERNLAGLIWFELAAGESIDDYVNMPRSDDVAERREELVALMRDRALLAGLQASLGDDPLDGCGGGFDLTRAVLKDAGVPQPDIEAACLCLIGLGAYCDCQVILGEAREALE